MNTDLLTPYRLNDTIELKNRVLMAPLTRCMADENLVPTQDMVEYYARRADTGLIISEATIIRPDGQGYPTTPGLFTREQIQGWKKVTDAVHANGGKMFAQLWHVGRVAHPHFFDGEVLAPSAIGVEGSVPRMRELTYITPKAATTDDIKSLIADFAKAAENAIEAGFDGVEIHGANGYLIDQFLHYEANVREDEYGQTPQNMARFALEVTDAVIAAVGNERTALRVTPGAYFNMSEDNRDKAVFDYLLPELEKRELAYLHGGIFDDSTTFESLEGKTTSAFLRAGYKGTLVGVGSYSFESAKDAINEGKFDLIAIGRPLIANPDYISKVTNGEELVPYSDEMLAELK
ncbi:MULTISPECIES: alkene reductase [unclassified Pseudoalteromonas]|jgi:N-ethylmaleimide reductase|uniref:alkene reductase n=1 Tax=unclassified Pseudoalteromonas TaxID=194690 RepID=UPI0007302BA5|nr:MULTISPECIES: alkene reductase [unclassified Pseudoalteromonas]KTD88797.1 alkene reductase [Pseudoalteromonas sp. H71]TMN78578.1 alkene reductase [Pseudoalteromonas sp. S410]TMN88694.1 alkene reductase [Pseudoalteromonas sp. S408]TMN96589.1 alkene reductase [Pseudoalteromonas sp. S407]TMN97232.1 alkene reductase [Pseudoalteromonas sp. S409]